MEPLWIGVAGSTILLAFFVANQLGKLTAKSWIYDAGNFTGAALLLAYAVSISAWPFAVLNGVWALVAVRDLAVRS